MLLPEDRRFPILYSKVHDVQDEALQGLFSEIDSIRHARLDGQQVVQFLDQSLISPEDRLRRKPFERSEVLLAARLSTKIGRTFGTQIYALCAELVGLRRASMNKPDDVENYHGTCVYVLLNKVFGKKEAKRKRR